MPCEGRLEFDIISYKSQFSRTEEWNYNYLRKDASLCKERKPEGNVKPEAIMYSVHEALQTHFQNWKKKQNTNTGLKYALSIISRK